MTRLYRFSTEQNIMRFLIGVIAVLAVALVVGCIIIIASLFTPVQYWDQWEMVKYLSQGGGLSIEYLFRPHNEHIIATSKILFYIDFLMFGYSNRFLVAMIVILHLSIAYTLTSTFLGARSSIEKLLWFSVFSAIMLSLSQWENLTIGFQTQFGLTGVFAVLACIVATRLVSDKNIISLTALGLATLSALTIFSMGNGVALVFSFIVIAVLMRASLMHVVCMCLIYGICLSIFIFLRHGIETSSHLDLAMVPKLPRFFLAVLGGSFTDNADTASNIGAIIILIFVSISVVTALLPWMKRKTVDSRIVILLAISVFAIASAAAVAVGRIALGPGAALAPRYTTPNLLLYCSLLGTFYTYVSPSMRTDSQRIRLSFLIGLAGLALASGLTFRPINLQQLTNRSETLTSAGYFVLSGVTTDKVLSALYPLPDSIRAPIDFLRTNKLNIFSPSYGLRILGTTRIEHLNSLAYCPVLDLTHSNRLEDVSWQVSGRIEGNPSGVSPAWVIAANLDGDVLGYAPPKRRQIDNSFEFIVPVHVETPAFDGKIYLIAQWNSGEICRYEHVIQLGKIYLLPKLPTNVVPMDYEQQLSLKAGMDQIPDPAIDSDQRLPAVRSTWQGDDAATGTITYTLPRKGNGCTEGYIGITRGPTGDGIIIETGSEGGEVETNTLDWINPHQWWWLKIKVGGGCELSEPSFVRLVDSGSKWGAWGAMTVPVAVRPN